MSQPHQILQADSVKKMRQIFPDAKYSPKAELALQKVLQQAPLRLTGHLQKYLHKSPALQKQFLPDARENSPQGKKKTWVGFLENNIKGLERMYLDRCIILPYQQCPAYCRFCFRKFYSKTGPGSVLTRSEIDRVIDYIKNDQRLHSVLITGGDPLMKPELLEYLLKKLREINHVGTIRIGSRSPMFAPELITPELLRMLQKYHQLAQGRPIEIATHFNHPDELTPESQKALASLATASFRLYNQTVLLKGINDDFNVLHRLFSELNRRGVEIYYLFHCEPVRGIAHFRTTIEKGLEIKKQLRELSSGRINPRYMISTQIGKVEIGVDGFIESKQGQELWIKTPYSLATMRQVKPDLQLPKKICRVGKDGQISIIYREGSNS